MPDVDLELALCKPSIGFSKVTRDVFLNGCTRDRILNTHTCRRDATQRDQVSSRLLDSFLSQKLAQRDCCWRLKTYAQTPPFGPWDERTTNELSNRRLVRLVEFECLLLLPDEAFDSSLQMHDRTCVCMSERLRLGTSVKRVYWK